MTLLEEILHANVMYLSRDDKNISSDLTSKPRRKVMIITCIDCRLVELLEPAMGIKRGDANIVKTAGNYIPPGINETIKTILVAIYELGVEEIFIVGHHKCGVASLTKENILEKMHNHDICKDEIHSNTAEITDWIEAYADPKTNVLTSVNNLINNPLIPSDLPVHGLIIDPDNGELELVVDGYQGK